MFQALQAMVGSTAIERLTLLINHVLAAEPAATQRLRAHTGRCVRVQFDAWPSLLPALPATLFRVTPAGLLEWCGADAPDAADLRVAIDASNPARALAQALAGARPKVEVAGDAAFAADLNWLFDHLRWDVQDDLARVVGAAPAREIARLGGAIAAGLREAVRAVGGLVAKDRSAAAAEPQGRNAAAEPQGRQAGAEPQGRQAAAEPQGRQAAAEPQGRQAAAEPQGRQAAAEPPRQ